MQIHSTPPGDHGLIIKHHGNRGVGHTRDLHSIALKIPIISPGKKKRIRREVIRAEP